MDRKQEQSSVEESWPKIGLFGLNKHEIEKEAQDQLEAVSQLQGMERIACFPDLHPGKGAPIGAAFASRDTIYPHLIGNDIGCGMALFESDMLLRKLKIGALTDKVAGLESPASASERDAVMTDELARIGFTRALGTIGGGNHFAELQAIEEVMDEKRFREASLSRASLYVLIHSGSRGLGQAILQQHVATHAGRGCRSDSPDGVAYRDAHDRAVHWAKANRLLIAIRLIRFLKGDLRPVLDLPHNLLERTAIDGTELELHRKGSNRVSGEMLVIPGSRGTLTFLVEPIGSQDANLLSLSHGAGRKWRRRDCRARLEEKFEHKSLLRTRLGGRVICEDIDLLYEEAPHAYKNIESVIGALERANLIRVVATLRPLLTYKTRRAE